MSNRRTIVLILVCVFAAAAAIGAIFIAANKKEEKKNTTNELTSEVITEYTTGENSHKAIKVACVGDSITYGYGLVSRDEDAYPAMLQHLLGTQTYIFKEERINVKQ